MSFTPEQTHRGMTALLVGVVARGPAGRLSEFLRPLGGASGLSGHFHAVVFPYDPLPQRTVAMQALVLRLFGSLQIRSILHLVQDDRGARGAGDNALLRGLCWAVRIRAVTEGSS